MKYENAHFSQSHCKMLYVYEKYEGKGVGVVMVWTCSLDGRNNSSEFNAMKSS